MSAASAQDLKDACDVFSGHLQDHHANTATLVGTFEGHLADWFGECVGWLQGEVQHIHDDYETHHKANLQHFVSWLEGHPPVIRAIGQKVMDLFNEVVPEGSNGSGGAAAGIAGMGLLGFGAEVYDGAGKLIGGVAKLGEDKFSVGRYTKSWSKVIEWTEEHGGGDLARFKKSPVLHFLNDIETPLKDTAKAVSGVATALNIANIVDEAKNGQWVDSAFDAIEAVKVPWPFSIAASPWEEVGRAVGNSINNPDYDWSAKGWHEIATANPVDWGKAIWDTAKEGKYTQPLINVVSGWIPW